MDGSQREKDQLDEALAVEELEDLHGHKEHHRPSHAEDFPEDQRRDHALPASGVLEGDPALQHPDDQVYDSEEPQDESEISQ